MPTHMSFKPGHPNHSSPHPTTILHKFAAIHPTTVLRSIHSEKSKTTNKIRNESKGRREQHHTHTHTHGHKQERTKSRQKQSSTTTASKGDSWDNKKREKQQASRKTNTGKARACQQGAFTRRCPNQSRFRHSGPHRCPHHHSRCRHHCQHCRHRDQSHQLPPRG